MSKSVFSTIIIGCMLLATMLLGDSRQHIVDVLVVGTTIFSGILLLQKKQLLQLPFVPTLLWVSVFITSFPLFSPDSFGPAPQIYVRYLLGFLLFSICYSVSNKETVRVASNTLLLVGSVVSLATMAFLFVDRPGWLPTMNLLYPSYGHNHAIDFLLIVFPLIIYQSSTSIFLPTALRIIFLVGVIFSFARGAWGLLMAYVAVAGFAAKESKRKLAFALMSVFFAALLVIGIKLPSIKNPEFFANTPISRLEARMAGKGNILADPRKEYWKQAITILQERPLFGSGAGSFYFGSRRLQTHPGSYSWFAHSFVLQTLAEQGAWGGIPVLGLVGWVIWQLIRFVRTHHPSQSLTSRLAIGALLSFAYSFFEFNMSFAVVWMIVWSISGLVVGANKQRAMPAKRAMYLYPLAVLGVFYVLYTTQSIVLAFWPSHARAAFFLTPFDAGAAQYYLSSSTFMKTDIPIVLTFHKKDPETMLAVAATQERLGLTEEATQTRRKLLQIDPMLEENHAAYLPLIAALGEYGEISSWFATYPPRLFPQIEERDVLLDQLPTEPLKTLSADLSELFDATKSHEVRYARFYYRVGLWYLTHDPKRTRKYWAITTALHPALSYYWVERAALEKKMFYNDTQADNLLVECLTVPAPAPHCTQVRSSNIPAPGHYAHEILK